MSECILSVTHLCKDYPDVGIRACDDVSFCLERGDCMAVCGQSGSGKTTLVRLITGLEKADSGSVVFEGKELTGMKEKQLNIVRKRLQLVFQNPSSSLDPFLTAGENIAMAVRYHHIVPEAEVRDYVLSVMKDCHVDEACFDMHPSRLSGGLCQRISIARALALKPEVLILDEPFSALDVSTQAKMTNLLRKLKSEHHLTLIVITHSLETARHLARITAVMHEGKIFELDLTQRILSSPSHPHAKRLVMAAMHR